MRQIIPALAFTLSLVAAAPAEADCTCRARGVVATEGQTLCIRTPQGSRLARCGKMSNVASWTFLQGPCPQAALQATERSGDRAER